MTTFRKRKAIQPIIATLLLVGISVTGGLTVYFWAGSFFNVSGSGLTAPNAEFLQIVGYDARDIPNIGGFSDSGAALNNNPAVGSLSTSAGTEEFIVLKLRNPGITPVLIDKIRIIGIDHIFDPDPPSVTDQPSPGTFEVYTRLYGDTSSKALPIIESSEEVRVAIRLSSEIPSHIELGRKTAIKIYTQQGNIMNYFITPGLAE